MPTTWATIVLVTNFAGELTGTILVTIFGPCDRLLVLSRGQIFLSHALIRVRNLRDFQNFEWLAENTCELQNRPKTGMESARS